MRVANVRLEPGRDADTLSADIGGFQLWYKVTPPAMARRSVDCFVAAALLPAMIRREPLELEASETASPRLLRGLDTLQTIFGTWRHELQRVSVHAATAPP